MKVSLLASGASIHTIRWANGLSAAGIKVHLISQHPVMEGLSAKVTTHVLPFYGVTGYFLMVPRLRKLLAQIQPDLVNAHFASGYGTTGRLVNYRPWLLSVWGSDVYDVPYKSFLHRLLVVSNLKAADAVASTSHCMAAHTRNLVSGLKDIAITPFGVDCENFRPMPSTVISQESEPFVIGTVKTLSQKYGIDILIRAFALARQALLQTDAAMAARLRLRIVGSGPDGPTLQRLAVQLHVDDVVEFVGYVPHSNIPKELNKLHVYAAFSRQESFGVAAIEAGAVGLPVVVSDAGGLPEVVLHGKTGLVVPKENPQAAAQALLELINDPDMRKRLGDAGRAHVLENYSWDACVKNMINVYTKVIEIHKKGMNNKDRLSRSSIK